MKELSLARITGGDMHDNVIRINAADAPTQGRPEQLSWRASILVWILLAAADWILIVLGIRAL